MKNKSAIAFFPTKSEISAFMISLISKKNNFSILETGFGKGIFIDNLINKYKNKKNILINGVEIDESFFEEVLSKYINNENVFLFNEDYLNFDKNISYDVIIGNPPYIKGSKLNNELKENVKKYTKTYSSDLYYAFIIKSIMLLKDKGELIYILPSTFFSNTYAKYLREFMMDNGYFEYIFDLGETPIFDTANVETIIFKYIKNKNIKNKHIKVIKSLTRKYSLEILKDMEICFKKEKSSEFFAFSTINQFEKNTPFSLENKKDFAKKCKLSDISIIGVGFASGKDEVFKLNVEELKLLNETEQKIFVKKFLKAYNLTEYLSSGEIVKMLFFDKNIKEQDLDYYPNIKKYLEKHKETLKDRYYPSKNFNFYSWLAIRNKKQIDALYSKNVIAVPCITRKQNTWFSLSCETNIYIGSDILFIYPKKDDELYFLLGFLNSIYFSELYKKNGAKKGERICFNQGFLSEFEIPIISEKDKLSISVLTKEIILKKSKEINNILFEQNKINEILSSYF